MWPLHMGGWVSGGGGGVVPRFDSMGPAVVGAPEDAVITHMWLNEHFTFVFYYFRIDDLMN